MTAESHVRLFVAAPIPDDVLVDLAAALESFKGSVPGARWTAVENQHVTLKFLGRVPSTQLPSIDEACREVAAASPPEALSVGGLGAFPTARRARVLWAAIDDPALLLTSVARGLDAGLETLGFEPEKRAFTPHLTLARLRTPGAVTGIVQEVEFQSRSFTLESFALYRSHLSPKGARYEVLSRYVLGDG